MIRGETVTLIRPAEAGLDAFGDPLTEWQPGVPVGNVLVAPASTDDLNGSLRRDGDRDSVTYRVIGDPQRYTASLTPGAWDLPVTVERTEG